MTILALKKEWYEKIERGEKTIEYREKKKYWDTRIYGLGISVSREYPYDWEEKTRGLNIMENPPRIIFSKGYTKDRLLAEITRVEIVWGEDTDLKIMNYVYAIHFRILQKVYPVDYYKLRREWK